MGIDIDLDVYDGLVDDIDHAELALRTAQADRLTAIYALHLACPRSGTPRPVTR